MSEDGKKQPPNDAPRESKQSKSKEKITFEIKKLSAKQLESLLRGRGIDASGTIKVKIQKWKDHVGTDEVKLEECDPEERPQTSTSVGTEQVKVGECAPEERLQTSANLQPDINQSPPRQLTDQLANMRISINDIDISIQRRNQRADSLSPGQVAEKEENDEPEKKAGN